MAPEGQTPGLVFNCQCCKKKKIKKTNEIYSGNAKQSDLHMEHHTFKKLGIVNTNSMYSLFHKHYSNRVFVTNLISRYCITETAKAYSNELPANLSRAPSSD